MQHQECTAALLVLTLLAVGRLQHAGGQHAQLPCAPGCEDYGTCNLELGRCACLWGYGGANCSIPLAPACRLTAADPSAHQGCFNRPHEHSMPLACECFRQCRAYIQDNAAVDADEPRRQNFCFERTSLPPEQQLSNLPGINETGVSWYRGYLPGEQKRVERDEATKWKGAWDQQIWAMPLEDCPRACNHRGYCLSIGGSTGENAGCQCIFGYTGGACEMERDARDEAWTVPHCINGCGGAERGRCMRGWCRCLPGYFGLDCSRTKVFAPREWRPRYELAIYVYELPPALTVQRRALELRQAFIDPIYTAYHHFMAALLQDWGVRTEDPYEANLFYVPAFTYDFTSNIGNPRPHLRKVKAYLQASFPFWNATGGRNHLLWFSHDLGGCEAPRDTEGDEINNAIRLTHFCYYGHDGRRKGSTCFDPVKDVCVVPYDPRAASWARRYYAPFRRAATHHRHPRRRPHRPQLYSWDAEVNLGSRQRLFFFAGDIREGDKHYSGGVRQQLLNLSRLHAWNASDMRINPPNKGDYGAELAGATFCLAPYGYGWGIRLIQVVANGCIPVIVQDHVFQFYEDVIPYWRFSLRIAAADMADLPALLAAVSHQEIERMQVALFRYHRVFLWGRNTRGYGLAYNATVASLQRALQYLRAGYYLPVDATQHQLAEQQRKAQQAAAEMQQ